jgi:protein-disulfide isomerase
VAAQVTNEMKEAGEVGVRGTPSFFINGKQPAGRSLELYKSKGCTFACNRLTEWVGRL